MWTPPDNLRRFQEYNARPVTAISFEHPRSVGVLTQMNSPNDGTYEQTGALPQYQTVGFEEAPAGAQVTVVSNNDPNFVPVASATRINGGRSKHRRKKSRKTKTRRRKTKTRRRKSNTKNKR